MLSSAMRQNDDELLLICKDRMTKTIRHHWVGISFEEVYRSAYHLVLRNRNNSATRLLDTFKQVIVDHMIEQVRDEVLRALQKESLSSLHAIYVEFFTCLKANCELLMYLDRVYMWQNKMGTLQALGLSLFCQHAVQFESVQKDLTDLFLKKFVADRTGDCVDHGDMQQTCQILLEMDGPPNRSLYSSVIEEPFLAASRQFFKETVAGLLISDEKVSYMDAVQKLITDETDRVKRCLDSTTVPLFSAVMEEDLVAKTMDTVFQKEEVDRLVENDCFEELSRLYVLVQRLPGGTKKFVNYVGDQLHKQATGRSMVDEKFLDDAVIFIKALLDIKERFELFSRRSFSDDPDFIAFTSDFLSRLILSHPRSSEFLSLYLDRQLRRAVTDSVEEGLKELTAFLCLIALLPDQQAFEAACVRITTKRVLYQGNLNLEFEKSIVASLNSSAKKRGLPHLERLLNDLDTSNQLATHFTQHLEENATSKSSFSFDVLTLSSGIWPCKPTKMAVNWPVEVRTMWEEYQAFYAARGKGRNISLLPGYGAVVVSGFFRKPFTTGSNIVRPFTYSLYVSPIQACILLLFNDQSEWSAFDLAVSTGILLKEVLRAVGALVCDKHKLLRAKGADSGGLLEALTAGTVLMVNEDFSASAARIKIAQTNAPAGDRIGSAGKDEGRKSALGDIVQG